MRKKLILLGSFLVFVMVGCASSSYFGVPNRAIGVPEEFRQTEAAIAQAEQSPGAKYCPEKIARAKELGKKAAETYWACRTDEAMGLLAEARKLAKEAEGCGPAGPARQPISFHSVYFDFNKSDLKPEATAELDRAAKIMMDNPDVVLELSGNTDSIGSDKYNMGLGERRAVAVFDYLKTKGVAGNRLKTVSYGKDKPVAPNSTDEGRAKNRRVDFTILK